MAQFTLLTLFAACSLLLAKAASQSTYNTFLSPPAPGQIKQFNTNGIYTIGDVVTIAWNTSYQGASLYLFQDANPSGARLAANVPNSGGLGSFTWTVNMNSLNFYPIDPSNVTFHDNSYWCTNVFFFQIKNAGDTSVGFNSHYFNVTTVSQAASSASASPTTSTAAASRTSGAVSETSGATSATATAINPQPSSSSGLSDAAKVGIGVGVGVGVGALLLGFAVGYFLWRRPSQKYHAPPQQPPPPFQETYTADHKYAPPQVYEAPHSARIQEMGPGNTTHELSTQR